MRLYLPKWALALLCPLMAAVTFQLYSNRDLIDLYPYQLTNPDLTNVKAKLDELGYDYQDLSDGRLLVARKRREEIRHQLSLYHLPRHRLLDKDSVPQQQGWPTMGQAQTVLWNRIVSEGELVQALRPVKGVEDVWVLLEDGKASILLKTDPAFGPEELEQILNKVESEAGIKRSLVEIQSTERKKLWPS